jgi:D-3-phosphoglycerate dehydrogenase
MKYNVLLLETIAPEAMSILEKDEAINVYFPQDDFENEHIHGVMTRGKGRVKEPLINSLSGLKGIARIGVGVDNVDVELATEKGIQVLNTPGENANTMAEHTLALILMLQRKLFASAASSKEENWESRVDYDGDEVGGKVLGIIGMGDIGEKVGHLASAFGMKVIYWNRSEKDVPFDKMELKDVAEQSDIISIHLPLTEATNGILDRDFLTQMKKGALLVNTARGQILDEEALIELLEEGSIGGFAADVLSEEPPERGHPLMSHSRTIITPHIGSLTKATYDRMCVLSVQNLIGILKGSPVKDKYLYNKVSQA